MKSKLRTPQQQARIDAAIGCGYVFDRDSEYRLGRKRSAERRLGCLSILFGNIIGHERAMVVYPDGSVTTQARKRGGSKTVSFEKEKLVTALRDHGLRPGEFHDEDDHFM